MESIDKFTIPEISSPKRANRKKRKARGQNVKDWENLRERWPDAPVSIEGVGLVSAHTSYTGSPGDVSGGAKELQTDEIIPRRVVKKRRRRTVMDSDEVAAEILNPPPTPAGHTVTAFGGGIIPEITNGGINRDAITGKALPRIGRRILNNARITGDQNPLTRIDANNNGRIFDGTSREMPDPTPGGSISGQMGLIDKFNKLKPKKIAPKKIASTTNNTPFGGVENLIAEQAEQVKKFETWAAAQDWKKFHSEHFDWWTFPVDRGSAGFGFRYDINGQPLEELKQRPDYLKSLSRAADLYMQSMAWDLKKQDWMDKPDFDRGQDPTKHINRARLFKVARSLQIHNLDDEFKSVRTMAHSLRSGGYPIGNDAFWDDPDNFNLISRNPNSGGVTGAMAGMGITPITFRNAINGKPRYDTSNEPWFIKKWFERDKANRDYFVNGVKPATSGITFWYKDESTRLRYIAGHEKPGRDWPTFFADFGGRSYNNKTGRGFSPRLSKLMKQIEQLGLMWGKTETQHGALYDPYGVVMTHSGSSTNQSSAEANQIRELLGHFSKEVNPSQYWERYNSWINNPYATAKDKNGKEVGVRLAFNDDKDQLVKEFDRRIRKLENDIRASYGLPPKEEAISQEYAENDNYSIFGDHVIKSILDKLDQANDEGISQAVTLKHITDELRDAITNSVARPEDLTKSMVLKLLKEKRPKFLEQKLKENKDFTSDNMIDSVRHSVVKDMRLMLEIQYDMEKAAGNNPKNLDIEKFHRENFPAEDLDIFKEIHRQELEKLSNNE